MQISVTVVIPAYKAAATIERAVKSVITQIRPANEIIVVDDGSPDGDELISRVQKLSPTIRIIRQQNGGAASARNRGIAESRSEWIAFLDADDYWEPEKLMHQTDIIRAYPQIAIIGSLWYTEIPGARRVPQHQRTSDYAGRMLQPRGREAFDIACAVWTGTLMVRKTVLTPDPFISGLEPAEDRDLWARLLALECAFIVPERLATYVQEPGGISRTNIDRDCQNMLRVVTRHSSLLGAVGKRHHEALVYLRWASAYLQENDPFRALPHAFARLVRQPLSIQAWWIMAKSSAGSVWSVASRVCKRS